METAKVLMDDVTDDFSLARTPETMNDRAKIVQELLESERTYVQHLETLQVRSQSLSSPIKSD